MKIGILGTQNIATLLLTPGIGKKTIQQIINYATFSPSTLEGIRDLLIDARHTHATIKVPTIDQLEEANRQRENIIEESERMGIRLIGIDEPQYPESLRSLVDPPVLLYTKGDISSIQTNLSVAVIGTRAPSDLGKKVGERIASKFASSGFIIVSGLAIGCDTAAHTGCLQVGGRTVAVLAHGLHMVYPAENRYLSEKILDSGGCLISEYPPGTKPNRYFFIERDRLQSGLSKAVVVVETGISGGTMHTVKFCLQQGRALACIKYPPDRSSEKSSGNRQLIEEGKAIPLWNPEEIDNFIKQIQSVDVSMPPIATDSVPEITMIPSRINEPCPSENHVLTDWPVEKAHTEEADTCHPAEINSITHVPQQPSLFPELIDKIEMKPQSKKKRTTLVSPPVATVQTLTAKAMAERLHVGTKTLTKQRDMGTEHFQEWSHSKDPENRSWQYSEEQRRYLEIDSITQSSEK